MAGNKAIVFHADNRYYRLDFKFHDLNIIQIVGDSSTGKSLLCSDFRRQQGIDPNLANSLVVNVDSHIDLLLNLEHTQHNIVIIDSASLLVTPKVDEFIRKDVLSKSPTRWVLMGRTYFDCAISNLCRGELQHTQKGNNVFVGMQYKKL